MSEHPPLLFLHGAFAGPVVGGLAFVLAEQVPPVGAFLSHESGWTLEVIAGNEKHVTRLRLHPPSPQEDPDD